MTTKKNSFKGWDWKRLILGLKRPIIVLIGCGLSSLIGYPQWAWLSGVSAERIWMTVEYYLKGK